MRVVYWCCIGDFLVLWGFSRGGLIFGETLCWSIEYPLVLQFLLSLRDEILGGNVPENVKRRFYRVIVMHGSLDVDQPGCFNTWLT